MLRGATLTVILAYLLAQATCTNYYKCNPRRCEVSLRTDAGWVCGRLRGAENGAKYASFRGIPYGRPPLGYRRFKELEPAGPWSFLLDCTEDAPACPQTDLIYGRMAHQRRGMSEDCMYLNLHVPSGWLPRFPWPAKGPGLPILVFIHGGAFQSGAGLTDILGPEYMLTKKVILITFNYRLNIFGFFSLKTIEIPGNQGLRDMVTLLRWVQRNARAFGGDPNNVTLMGQSGGATSAHILSLSQVTKGLFKRVILMSCTAVPTYYTTSAEYANEVNGMFLRELGINQTDPVLIHRELTQLPLLKLMNANTAVLFNTSVVYFGPIVESPFPGVTRILDAEPVTLIAQGRGREYPQIVSYTDNEYGSLRWLLVQKNILPIVKQDITVAVSPRLVYTLPEYQVKEIAERIDQRYFKGNVTLDGLMNYLTDMHIKYPVLKVAEWRAALGGAPTYMYKFSYELGFSPVKAAHWVDYRGAAHMDDLACVFRVNSILDNHNMYYPSKNTDDAMNRWMVYLITNFMICSNPTCNNNALWPPVSKNKLQYNLISAPMRIHMMEPTIEERDMVRFFDSIDPESRKTSALLWESRVRHRVFNDPSTISKMYTSLNLYNTSTISKRYTSLNLYNTSTISKRYTSLNLYNTSKISKRYTSLNL